MNPLALIPTVVSLVSAVIAITIAFTLVQAKVSELTNRDKEFKENLEAASSRLNNAAVELTKIATEQNIINKFTAATLESLIKRVEINEHALNDLSATVKVIGELVKRIEANCNECSGGK